MYKLGINAMIVDNEYKRRKKYENRKRKKCKEKECLDCQYQKVCIDCEDKDEVQNK